MTMRLYADNAATSFPKPPEVLVAMQTYAQTLGASAGRGAYREAIETGNILASVRRRLARLIGAENPENIIFTLNCSSALNLAIKGLLRSGDHVVTTMMEHNSVLRPLHALAADGVVDATYVQVDPATGLVDPDDILRAAGPNTRLIAVIHGSNVTGTVQPIDQIGMAARRRGIPFLVDAAQTAGHRLIDVQAMAIDLLAMPGHKGLMGPLGTGALYIRPAMAARLRPLMEGGTGSVSERPIQPDFLPDRFEPGSHNAIGLAGLDAALQWIDEKTICTLQDHDLSLCSTFLERATEVDGLTVYGPRDPHQRVAVFSVRIAGYGPAELANRLESEYGILTRSGIHCAPFAHRTLRTDRDGGTTRLSFGAFNTIGEIDRCIEALARLSTATSAAV